MWGSLYLGVRKTPGWNRDRWLGDQALETGWVWEEEPARPSWRKEDPLIVCTKTPGWEDVRRGTDSGEERPEVNDRQEAAVLFPGSPDA